MLDEIFMSVLDMTTAASLVILAVIGVRFLLKGAPKSYSYALWAVVLLRLLCPLSLELPVSVMPEITPVSESYTLSDEPISFAGASLAAYRAIGDAVNGGLDIQRIPTTETDLLGNVVYIQSYWWEVWVLFGQYVWLAGMAGLAVHSLVSCMKLKGRLREAMPLESGIFLADRIETPFVMGLIRPRIYLPSSLPEGERGHIIAHERYHIRRLDHWTKALAFAALCIHWFNPLVWLAFSLAGRDMEMSCDEAVIGRLGEAVRADYSASLLSLATGRRYFAGTPLAFGEGDTGSRIRNLAKWKKPALWVSTAAVLLVIAVGAVLLIDPAAPEQPETTAPAVESTPGMAYVSKECLYMNPLSSYAAFGGDSGCRYIMLEDSFIIERRDQGLSMEKGYEVYEGGSIVFENIEWTWRPVSEAGKEMDALFENSRFFFADSPKRSALWQPLGDNYFLIRQDGGLLLYETRNINKMGRQVWSIYSLVPEQDMGSVQWTFDPASSAELPLFCFEFDVDFAEINAVCTQSSFAPYDELKNTYITPQLKGGNTFFWSPVNEFGEIVTVADIGFTVHNGDMTTGAGRIYITGEETGNTYLYTATIVGNGLLVEQSPDGGAVITFSE